MYIVMRNKLRMLTHVIKKIASDVAKPRRYPLHVLLCFVEYSRERHTENSERRDREKEATKAASLLPRLIN
jgi:hypothetical protein